MSNLSYNQFIVRFYFFNLILLDSYIAPLTLIILMIIYISKDHPFIHKIFRTGIIVFFILFYPLVIIFFSCIVHLCSIAYFQRNQKIINWNYYVRNIKVETEGKSCPANTIEHLNWATKRLWITLHDSVENWFLNKMNHEEKEKR